MQIVAEKVWPDLSGRFRDLTYEQSLTYAQAAARRIGAELQLLRVECDGELVAAAAVRIKRVPGLRRGIAWIASGPLTMPVAGVVPNDDRYRDILRALRDHLVTRDGHVLRLRFPGIAFHEAERMDAIAAKAGFDPAPRVAPYRSFAMDLSLDEESLMTALKGKWRTDLRYAQKSGLGLDSGLTPDLEERFLALFEEVQKTKEFRPDITPEFHFALQGDDLRHDILIATKDGTDIAGIVTGSCARTAVYLYGATSDIGRRLRAGYFLTWQGIALARARGLAWYDLGGVDFEENPSVARFKERMNGRPILAAGPYEARPAGVFPYLVDKLETLREKIKARR
ncbi:peptidoglycan bridge formation glycyltransferase FemA/FemB family protein [Marimonas arenosa]|uniref:Peptidoglycan bridge formation glycyltransferase FemA/FemB family protein n=1 Tax=Marimonas arenosa TaxID=1795305 RepID=A0AAE3WAL4_9RHOB|nr:peptidoglycan bridge formation glycyltransferase FemA/FemB family protein [Marimonas arenosa]